MGAARVLSSCGSVEFITASDGTPQLATVDKNNDVGLCMHSVYEEAKVDASSLLRQCGIKAFDLVPAPIVNASVARSKTLVKLISVEALHKVTPPTDPDAFRMACDDIHSTGLYLYAESSPGVFECRQFPRASGYPEDPATGIAAGALAVHLHPTVQLLNYDIFQGTAMGRPSLIQIRNLEMKNDNNVKLECWGRVEIDFSDELII
jgi:PhzF family phenazine biosynthesis protein